jgi:hypothetical protein
MSNEVLSNDFRYYVSNPEVNDVSRGLGKLTDNQH